MCWNEGEREGIPTNVTFYTCVPVQLCGLLTRSVNVDDLMPAAKSATQLETNPSRPKPVEREGGRRKEREGLCKRIFSAEIFIIRDADSFIYIHTDSRRKTVRQKM